MNVHDYAHALAKAIKNSGQYRDWQQAKANLEADKPAHDMMVDFRKEQLDMQGRQLAGEDTAEQEQKVRKLFEIVSLNELVRAYIGSEYRFSQLMADIQKILAEALEEEGDY